MYAASDQHWGIVLAGGEGQRLRDFIRLHWGSKRPKQYCTLIGGQSMLRHTLARAERLLSPERLLTIVSREHLGYAREELYDRPPGTVIVQPGNRGTAPGILLPLLHVYQRDPDAIVTLLPSDHFIVEEERLMAAVGEATRVVASHPGRLVVLGVEPDRPETEYGWIEVGERLDLEHRQHPFRRSSADLLPSHMDDTDRRSGTWLYRVMSFCEKPRLQAAKALYRSGCLWNTLILTGKVWMLLLLFQMLTPQLFLRFQQIQPVLGERGEAEALQKIYGRLHTINFSEAILTRSVEVLTVLRVTEIYWSDWGNPEQVSKDVARFALTSQHEPALRRSPSLAVPD